MRTAVNLGPNEAEGGRGARRGRRVEMMIAACRRHGKIPGLLVQDVASAKEWIAKGIRLVPYSNEVSLLMHAAARAIGEIRSFATENR
jgi:2-keto-3-deoxy-L-rhamnonate aldolase RhmA